jgi:hypothetical protein
MEPIDYTKIKNSKRIKELKLAERLDGCILKFLIGVLVIWILSNWALIDSDVIKYVAIWFRGKFTHH